jgi:hypothetical protein
MKFRLAIFSISLLFFSLLALRADASSLTWRVQSNYPYSVDLTFYSALSDRAWPGGTQVWVLNNNRVHTFNLSCIPGEQICYGAWVRGDTTRYWGVGYGGLQGCTSCCYYCNGGQTQVMILNP